MSPQLPALRPREVIRAPGDLKRSVLASILEQAGLTTEEFLDLL